MHCLLKWNSTPLTGLTRLCISCQMGEENENWVSDTVLNRAGCQLCLLCYELRFPCNPYIADFEVDWWLRVLIILLRIVRCLLGAQLESPCPHDEFEPFQCHKTILNKFNYSFSLCNHVLLLSLKFSKHSEFQIFFAGLTMVSLLES